MERYSGSRLPVFRSAWYERVVNGRPFQLEWDEAKADANARKHGITFELASTVFFDPNLLTVADVEHSETEERWFSVGIASNGVVLAVVYVWSDADPAAIKVRLISARKATHTESEQYQEGL
ncbi:MAG TPA: BrnT family toxin [Candidatus Eremiobacteraceae bacterium]|jgi:uncharacterized DUF497 family protein|nr:BrnT family toxin [Candidatus Eremiobacteraceae bacterium]